MLLCPLHAYVFLAQSTGKTVMKMIELQKNKNRNQNVGRNNIMSWIPTLHKISSECLLIPTASPWKSDIFLIKERFSPDFVLTLLKIITDVKTLYKNNYLRKS